MTGRFRLARVMTPACNDAAALGARIAVVTAFLLVVAVVLVAWSRMQYKEWPWSAYPNPLHYCGHDYVPSGSQTEGQILASGVTDFARDGNVPGWLNHGRVWTGVLRGEPTKADRGARNCGAIVWVHTGTARFQAMRLEGGP
jgi:hypothetical protein